MLFELDGASFSADVTDNIAQVSIHINDTAVVKKIPDTKSIRGLSEGTARIDVIGAAGAIGWTDIIVDATVPAVFARGLDVAVPLNIHLPSLPTQCVVQV